MSADRRLSTERGAGPKEGERNLSIHINKVGMLITIRREGKRGAGGYGRCRADNPRGETDRGKGIWRYQKKGDRGASATGEKGKSRKQRYSSWGWM